MACFALNVRRCTYFRFKCAVEPFTVNSRLRTDYTIECIFSEVIRADTIGVIQISGFRGRHCSIFKNRRKKSGRPAKCLLTIARAIRRPKNWVRRRRRVRSCFIRAPEALSSVGTQGKKKAVMRLPFRCETSSSPAAPECSKNRFGFGIRFGPGRRRQVRVGLIKAVVDGMLLSRTSPRCRRSDEREHCSLLLLRFRPGPCSFTRHRHHLHARRLAKQRARFG